MMENFVELIQNFHFLRPLWFLGLVPALAIIIFLNRKNRSAGGWESIIDAKLLPILLQGDNQSKRLADKWLPAALFIAWAVSCLSLAGPSWQQLPQPVHKQVNALVVILDLSPSMLAEDVTPSRLVRARYKLIDILSRRNEGVVGLVVYAGDAHTVSPLTEDSNTIISIVPVLSPSLLPEYGSNIEDAAATAVDLAIAGGYQRANILLITDGIDNSALQNVNQILSQQGDFRLSILGVGSADGAPIPTGAGGFAKNSNGNVVIAKLNSNRLRALAANNEGLYRTISADDRDVDALLDYVDIQLLDGDTREVDRQFDLWDDQGFWLILLLLPLLILCFRKGAIVILVFLPMSFNSPSVGAFEWQDLWKTPDQQGAELLESGDAEAAQAIFDDPRWRGSAAYKANDYAQAVSDFAQDSSATGHYNRGNALARAGQLEQAIDAYDDALTIAPEMEDASANKALIEQLKKNQDQQNQDQQNQDQQNQDQQNQDQQNQDQQNQDQQNQDQQNQEQQNQDQQNQNQQSQEQQSQEQQNQDQQNQDQQNQEQQNQDRQNQEQRKQAQEQQKQEQQTQEQMQATDEDVELSDEEKREQQLIEQMLRRVPDDPGGLLRAKFRYQSRQNARNRQPPNQERW